MVVALPTGALAAGSLAQDAREARGAVASLVVVAGTAVLTAQHGIVAHPGLIAVRYAEGRGVGSICVETEQVSALHLVVT